MWTSEARSLTACDSKRFTTWTTGAFSSKLWLTATSVCDALRASRPLLEHADVLADVRDRLVGGVDGAADVREPTDVELGGLLELVAQLVDQARLGRVGDHDVVSELGLAQRDGEKFAGRLLGERGDRLFLRHLVTQVHHFEVELIRERTREVALVEDAGVDEVLTEPLAGLGLALERGTEIGFAQQARARRAPHRAACGAAARSRC